MFLFRNSTSVTTFITLTLLILTATGSTQAWADRKWTQVPLSEPFVDSNGKDRSPGCSGGPVILPPNEIVEADTSFSFFMRKGNPRKLLIALDGGGACWDPNTCIGSAIAGTPIYTLAVDETVESLNDLGGVFNLNEVDNPFADYTQVFVPYCTADIHWGSKDMEYPYLKPDGTLGQWTIHHRGYDNFLAVLDWLKSYYHTNSIRPPDKVVVGGASAGGYGALLALPAVKAMLPRRTRTHLLVDSSNGVISEDFYNKALGGHAVSGGAWGVENTVPDFLLGSFASGHDTLPVSTFTSLAWRYPRTHIGQYTRAWDSVQIFYYNVTKELDFPERWNDPEFLLPTALEWTLKARTSMWLSALAPNYRFYIAAGNDHTVLADESFYSEDSAGGLHLSDWVDDMINKRSHWWFSRGSDWRNVSCFPNCLGPDGLTP